MDNFNHPTRMDVKPEWEDGLNAFEALILHIGYQMIILLFLQTQEVLVHQKGMLMHGGVKTQKMNTI